MVQRKVKALSNDNQQLEKDLHLLKQNLMDLEKKNESGVELALKYQKLKKVVNEMKLQADKSQKKISLLTESKKQAEAKIATLEQEIKHHTQLEDAEHTIKSLQDDINKLKDELFQKQFESINLQKFSRELETKIDESGIKYKKLQKKNDVLHGRI